jgi:hypothetical protein
MLNEFVEGGFRLPGASTNDLINCAFCCYRQKVSRTASGRRAGCCVKKAKDGGKRQRIKKSKHYDACLDNCCLS